MFAVKGPTFPVREAHVEAARVETERPEGLEKCLLLRPDRVSVAGRDEVQHLVEMIEVVAGR